MCTEERPCEDTVRRWHLQVRETGLKKPKPEDTLVSGLWKITPVVSAMPYVVLCYGSPRTLIHYTLMKVNQFHENCELVTPLESLVSSWLGPKAGLG